MAGNVATLIKKAPRGSPKAELRTITPAMAQKMLEHNKLNRPLNDAHVKRLMGQIEQGKWQVNGDTIKIADTGDIVDGQHRLWAVFNIGMPIDTFIVEGVPRDAFATIDTLRKPRSGGDVLSLMGVSRHRAIAAEALKWLLRWQKGNITEWRNPENRIENSDIEEIFANHKDIILAAEKAVKVRNIANPALVAFFYYVLSNRNTGLAERFMATMHDPSGYGITDGFFKLRSYFLSGREVRREPLMSIALMIKAANAVDANKPVSHLLWRDTGTRKEEFPVLKVSKD